MSKDIQLLAPRLKKASPCWMTTTLSTKSFGHLTILPEEAKANPIVKLARTVWINMEKLDGVRSNGIHEMPVQSFYLYWVKRKSWQLVKSVRRTLETSD